MTKDEIIAIYIEVSNKLCNGTEWCWAGVDEPLQLFAKLVAEKAIKEALAQTQEPVAWEQFYPDIGKPQIAINSEVIGYVEPQRTWVGLTDAEIKDILDCGRGGLVDIKKTEAKLKDKNTQKTTGENNLSSD